MPTLALPNLWRVNMSGVLGSGEIFDFGWWVASEEGTDAAAVQAATQLGLTAFFATPATALGLTDVLHMFPSTMTLNKMTVTKWDSTTNEAVGPGLPVTVDYIGAGSASSLPFQVACVVTLWNGISVGRHRYNRFYLPPFTPTITVGSGRVPAAACTILGAAVQAAVMAMQAATPESSLTYYSGVTKAMGTLVDAIVDDVFDTQRRRRNQLVPVKHPTALG